MFSDENDALLLLLMIVFTIFITIFLLVFLIIRFCRSRVKNPVVCEIDILRALKDSNLFPIEQSNGWTFRGYERGGQQIWSHPITVDPSKHPTDVYAALNKVKGSSQMVLGILKDLKREEEWNLHPRRLARQETTSAPSLNKADVINHSVCRDVICVEENDDKNENWITCFRTKMRSLIGKKTASVNIRTIHRFWHREENGCCWLLEYDSKSVDWTFSLMQPIEGWFGSERCMLTLISCQFKRTRQAFQHDERVATKLASIKDYLLRRRTQTIPLVKLSLDYHDEEVVATSGLDGGAPTQPPPTESKDPSQELTLIQKFKNMIEGRKEELERKRKLAVSSVSSSSAAAGERTQQQQQPVASGIKPETASQIKTNNPLDILRRLSPSKSQMEDLQRKNSIGKTTLKEEQHADRGKPTDLLRKSDSVSSISSEVVPDGNGNGNGKENTTLRKRVPLLAEIGRSKTSAGSSSKERAINRNEAAVASDKQEDAATGVSQETNVGKKQKSSSRKKHDGKHHQSENSDENRKTVLNSKQIDEDLENRFTLMAEAAAVEILLEKTKVTNLDITSHYKEQARSSGGWTYHGLKSDTVILRKMYDEGILLHSYMGKGMIPFAPRVVFDVVRKPSSRLFYDDMLKKVEVVHEFQNSMKIIYMYHEVSQLSTKECRDFCVLQSERIEGVKYIITLQSVQWSNCKETDNVTRAKMLPSGWIIEPVIKEKKLHSMVTYVTHMELGGSCNKANFVEELAVKQPLCIVNIRNHLVTQHEASTTSDQRQEAVAPSSTP